MPKTAACHYCGALTSLHAYESTGGPESLIYPACCNADTCIEQWTGFTVEKCPPEVLALARSRPPYTLEDYENGPKRVVSDA